MSAFVKLFEIYLVTRSFFINLWWNRLSTQDRSVARPIIDKL